MKERAAETDDGDGDEREQESRFERFSMQKETYGAHRHHGEARQRVEELADNGEKR
jgi:hypothetical protein